ncbi:uncharacterized protein FYW49_016953 [Xenentodon cancila]
MPSEAQSQEPRDRGPPPPVTRAGRSAQLAKAAATSPAPEKRPRGRPRKDGSNGRTAPPTPPPPHPTPPKSRKKGRSRGRAQVEDEESPDATETSVPQKTDAKEVKEAKEAKEVKEAKEAKEVKEAKEAKEVKEAKEAKEVKEAKEAKEVKEAKEAKEVKEAKEAKEVKEAKEAKEVKEAKEAKEEKEAKDAKAPGRRRSTSRRKSNTNPEPDPEPDPEQDPEPDPQPNTKPSKDRLSPPPEPDPKLTVLQSCSEPAPGAEVEDRTSPPLALPLPDPSHGVGPQLSPPPPSPNVIPVYPDRPYPDPVEADQPKVSHSPAPMEDNFSPSRVAMETDESGASSTEQSPALSPCFSPPVSPCLRLEDDDEDSLSPLFQRSLSEDSGGSPTPIPEHAKKRLKQCAFCYRGDGPPLGQGRLLVFGPTPGYIPLHILNRRASSDRDNDCHDHCYRGNQAPSTCSSPDRCEDESSSEFMKQLGLIGLPHDISVQSLFDPTGQCCAHLQCATWSEGVRRGEGQSLLFVDKAIDSGSTQVCTFCRRLGASLRCQEMGCGRSYHFPCAAAAGAHQDWTQRRTLCTRHTHTGSLRCVSCSGSAEPSGLLMCCCCGDCYHGSCLEPPLAPSPLRRAGWQCPRCQVCRSCRSQGDEDVLLVCQRCDKTYHTHCLTPPLDCTPGTGWTCKNCRVCRRCGVTSSGQWANHPFLCESCDPALPCPLCDHSPNLYTPQEYLTCTCCYRCVHIECLGQAGEGRAGSEGFICSTCSPQGVELISHTSTATPLISHTPALPTVTSHPHIPSYTEAPPTSHTAASLVQILCSEACKSPSKGICVLAQQNLGSSQSGAMEIQRSPPLTDLQQGPSQSPSQHKQGSPPSPSKHQQEYLLSSTSLKKGSASSPSDRHGLTTSINDFQESSARSSKHIDGPEGCPTDLHSSAQAPTEIIKSPSPEEQHQSSMPSTKVQDHLLKRSIKVQDHLLKKSINVQDHLLKKSINVQDDLLKRSINVQDDLLKRSIKVQDDLLKRSIKVQDDLLKRSIKVQDDLLKRSIKVQDDLLKRSIKVQDDLLKRSIKVQDDLLKRSIKAQDDLLKRSIKAQDDLLKRSIKAQDDLLKRSIKAQDHLLKRSIKAQDHLLKRSIKAQDHLLKRSIKAQDHLLKRSIKAQDHLLGSEIHHSPAPSPEEIHHSPAPSPEEIHHSPAPSPEEIHHSPAPSPEEIHHSPAPSPEEIHHSPAPSPEEIHHSPAPSPEEIHHSPAPSPEEIHHSPAPSPEEIHHSPAPSPEEIHHSPAPSPEEIHHSPAPSPEEIHHSPAPSPEEIHHSPAPSPEEIHHSPAPSPEEIHHSPAPSPEEIHHSPAPSPEEIHHSPAPSPEEIHHSPAPSPEEIHHSPAPSPEEIHHSPAPSPEEIHHSPAPSPEEIHHSPAPSPEEIHHSPAPSPEEIHHSPAPSPEEIHHSPAPSPEEIHQSPAPSREEIHQSPAPSPEEIHQSPAPSPEEIHQSPAPSPEEIHQSPAPSPEEIHQSPAPSAEEIHQSPAPSAEEIHQSPAPSAEEIHQSPAPSAEEIHQSPAPSAEEIHQSPAPSAEEIHQSPAPSAEEIHQSPAPSAEEIHQSPAPSAEEIHQSPDPSAEEIHQSPDPSAEEIHQSPAPCPEEIHQSPAPCPEEIHQSPAPCPEEIHQSPAPCPEEIHQSPAPSSTNFQPGPSPAFEVIHQYPISFSTDLQQGPGLASKEIPKSLVFSQFEPAGDEECSTQSHPAPAEYLGNYSPTHIEPEDFRTSSSSINHDHAAFQDSPSSPQPDLKKHQDRHSPLPRSLPDFSSGTGFGPGPASLVEPEPSPGPSDTVEPEPSPGPADTVEPEPSPGPADTVEPEPRPEPSPGPADTVEPEPSPGPADTVEPEPSPGPADTVEPEPSPGPSDTVEPEPSPGPADTVEPEPSPGPADTVEPEPSPGPADTVEPEPSPGPADTVEPEPSPGPADTVEPEPSPGPADTVEPEPSPGPADTVEPEPSPGPADTVEPEPRPEPGPGPADTVESEPSLGNASHVQAEPSLVSRLRPGPYSSVQPEPTSGLDPDRPVHAPYGQCEIGPSPGSASPVHSVSGSGPVGFQQQTETEVELVDAVEDQRKTQEKQEEEREASHEEEEGEEFHLIQESPDKDEKLMKKAERGEGGDHEEEKNQLRTVSFCSSGVQLMEQQHSTAVVSSLPTTPLFPHVSMPQSALPIHLASSHPSSSSSALVLPTPQLPPSSPACFLEASPSSPHRDALPASSTQSLPPSTEEHSQEDKTPNEGEGERGIKEEVGLLSFDSQSQSLFEPVTIVTDSAKDQHQSHTAPSKKVEGQLEEMLTALDVSAACPDVAKQQPVGGEPGAKEQEEKPLSPVLDLDSSLDVEVMELMSSSAAQSLVHLSSTSPPVSSRRGKCRTLRLPLCSSRPLDDLSIRLRQSPFSTEASPETSPARPPVTPPPLTPPSPVLRSSPPSRESPPLSKAPPTTVLPLTPKIGMGKPAISKRKFSPGRARVKQGSWWSSRRAPSPPSSSQDSMGEGGWCSPKPRPSDSPLWSMRVGRGSGFPGRRRSRGGGVGGARGGRGRSRLKAQDSLTVIPGCGYVEPFQAKEEEENSMHNTVVMFSTSDHFTLRQDMCVVCGSFGQGAEGRLLACSQCGQCYHPYCVNVKITRVVLTKGWRCLECTVCEACGEASDPGRLLLCDDCDISYHTYCLDPPLHTVPKGAWKCKWCVWCVQCGSTSPGLRCDWQSNYSRCGPCCSLSRCPLCQRPYTQDDLILQCQQCDRWVHAVCHGMTTEEEVEVAADDGFDCSLCRTQSHSSYGKSEALGSYVPHIISRIREPDTKTYTQDGVCLTESGLSHLQSLVEPLTSPRRYRRCKPKLKLRIINQNSVSVLQTPPDQDLPTEQDHSRGVIECDMKSDSSPERDHVHDDDLTKEPEVTDGNKKRKRKPYRPGIGGFTVRQRGGKAGPSRVKLSRKDSMETSGGQDKGVLDADVAMETAAAANQLMEKGKKRYRKKKTKLEEEFPSYLQEAFFGRDLLDRSRHMERRTGPETPSNSQSEVKTGDTKGPAPAFHISSPSGMSISTMATTKKQGNLPMSEEALVDLSDVLNTDPHILATEHTGRFQVERSPSPFVSVLPLLISPSLPAGLDISSMTNDPSLSSEPTGSCGRDQRTVQEEPLDAILSPELDKMVTEGAILSKLYKIPELEGKDVEELFTAVLSPGDNKQPEPSQHPHAAGNKGHTHSPGFPRLPLMNGLMTASAQYPSTPMMPGRAQGLASFMMPPPEGPSLIPVQGPTPGLASANQASAEGEQDSLSTAQRSMLKWEKEESLGELATVAPVLYCNTNFPQLKLQYPEWSTRVKQIAKLWRKASSQDRAPYVQKARDNRAAQRISKVQLSNDPLKRLQPSSQQQQQQQQPQQLQQQQLPPLGAYDPISVDTEMTFKDPLRPRESEQEQEWKFRQQMRQKSKQLAKMEATQKLEQVKNEQLQQQRQQQQQQQLLSGCLSPETGSNSPLTPTQQPVTGGNASPLHPTSSLRPADDVFLRPQAPPPSGLSSLPHSPHASSPLHQPPSSPQMFSPPSSRPSSPWDPYSKVAVTPRPTSSQSGGPPAPQQQLRASPAHDAMGSPAPSPDSKNSDSSRVLGHQPGLQQSRGGMMTPPSGSNPDLSARHAGARPADAYQRNACVPVSESLGRGGELVQAGVFKAPMPPQQEVFSSTGGGGRKDPSRPTDLGFTLPQLQEPPFPSSPLSGLGSPHRSPYAQTPGTPRPDYSQQSSDHFSQQSPLSSRPSPDPYSNPQTPGTPRPHSDPTYLTNPPALRLDPYNQQPAGPRPSASHPQLDSYGSSPGTPCPSERFPRSPGNQRGADPYSQPVGTPRPSLDPYIQQPSTPRPQKGHESMSQAPVESYTPQPAACGSSPLASGLSAETGNYMPTHHQLQRSPGKQQQHQQQQQQDSCLRPPSNQTPKHPGVSEESGFPGLAGHTQGQAHFEAGHMTLTSAQTDKTAPNEISALGMASLDGSMSILPQLGDSEEKLRQRQRLRQLILRQQHQKSALRQEKGLQEAAAGPAVPSSAGSATPLPSWPQQEESSTAPQPDPFGRPPPPYPGTIRPSGSPAPRFPGGFPAEQQRVFTPGEAPLPRPNLPIELGVKGSPVRFGCPSGALAVHKDSFLRQPQGSLPASGINTLEGNPVQTGRPVPSEFTSIRPLTLSPGPHMMPGGPQPFAARSLAMPQHNIMPFIELRHRTPESRLRLPFPLPTAPDPRALHLHPRDPQSAVLRPGLARIGEGMLGQQMVIGVAGMEQLNQQDQQHLGHAVTLTQSSDSALPGVDGIEEHLEGEDSAVKDLEDVEVKDLVDLNLNLDPEDGKDLDLGPNDLPLDDILLSGKFDLIAYADPELNLEDKKDMFNEELDLGETVEEKEGGVSRKADVHPHLPDHMKQEVKDAVKMEVQHPALCSEAEATGPPALICKEQLEDSGSVSGAVLVLQTQEQTPPTGLTPRNHPLMPAGQQSAFHQQQRPFGPSPSSSAMPIPHPQRLPLTPQGPPAMPHPQSLQPPQPHHILNPQSKPPHPSTSTQNQNQAAFSQNQTQLQIQDQNKSRPLLLEEQPLLLQDLLDQERQEQQQQKQMQALIRQRSTTTESVFPNTDLGSEMESIMKAKMMALKGINKVMSQGNLGLNPMVINRFQQAPRAPGDPGDPGDPGPEGTPQPPHLVGQEARLNPQLLRRNPPSFGPGFVMAEMTGPPADLTVFVFTSSSCPCARRYGSVQKSVLAEWLSSRSLTGSAGLAPSRWDSTVGAAQTCRETRSVSVYGGSVSSLGSPFTTKTKPARNPARNPAGNPARNPARNPAHEVTGDSTCRHEEAFRGPCEAV